MPSKKRRIPEAAQYPAGNAPAVLLPYQQRWIADKSAVKVCEKSRRVGLSWAEAADDTLFAASVSGDDVWYIGYNLDMAREFINDCGFWARQYEFVAGEVEQSIFEDEDSDKNILALRIKFASGHRITALSSRPTNLRGKQGRVVIDEAAFHDDLDGLRKAAMALLMWGGSVRIISTHDGDSNSFAELISETRAGKWKYSLHRITFDEALQDGLFKRICLKLGRPWSPEAEAAWRQEIVDFYGTDADEELFCIPSQGKGTYLSRVIIERCQNAEIPLLHWACDKTFATLPDHIRQAEARDWCVENIDPILKQLDPRQAHFYGEDFGRSGDLTVLWPLAQRPDMSLHTPLVIELRNVPFREQELILFHLVDRLPSFHGGAMDARGNGQFLAEVAMQRYGERIHQIMLTVEWYRAHMPRFKAAFEDGTISVPKHVDIMNDLRAIKMDKGVAKVPETARLKGSDGQPRHADAAIAAALAVYASAECEPGIIVTDTMPEFAEAVA